ncbi:MAG: heme-binding protein [Chloroflexi bacterium]|nr:heme-binding protein [Chloroflexota bacterium]MCC6896282.1 heme-binding protein [Anaerolineae bacterium]
MHQRTVLSHTDAMKVINLIQRRLEAEGKGAAVAVCDSHGELIAFVRTDGCKLPSISIAMNKAFTAAREQKASKAVGDSSREKPWPMTNFGDPRYTAWGGGVPIVHNGVVIGAVGVSGLPEEEDMVLAQLGVDALV